MVEVTHTGRTLTSSDVRGTISVTNPATTSRLATISDTFAGITCVVADGLGRVIPAASSTDFTFTCDTGTNFQPRTTDSNVAAVTWSDGGVEHTLTTPAEEISWDGLYLDNTVDVQDIDGAELSVLGSLTVGTDGSLRLMTPESGTLQGSTARFAYRVQLDGRAGKCTPYNTTAVVAGDEGKNVASDAASVQVCAAASAGPGLPHTGH
ncbi:hypothetical protein [Tessaracoccus antarcticus]|nr:hypothetical protein [Tessaracoccus antarcticus]